MTKETRLPGTEPERPRSTFEFMLEVQTTIQEMNDTFAGLRQLGQRVKPPYTFNSMVSNAELFGTAGELIKASVESHRTNMYTSGKYPGIGQMAISQIFNGIRPGLEEFQLMQEAWDLEEQTEIPYVIYRAFDYKYYSKDFYMDLSGLDNTDFNEPVWAALSGQEVKVVDLQTKLVEGPDRDWYKIEKIDFAIKEA